MITIVATTNRNGSVSSQVAKYYSQQLNDKNIENQIVDLQDIPTNYLANGLYETAGKNLVYNELRDKVQSADKLVFVIPEYNGSFPGILKLFIDGLKFPEGIKGKTAALIGISAGPLGAALGMSHFTDILNYLNCNVLSIKPRITDVSNAFINGEFKNQMVTDLINEQLETLIKVNF